MEIDTDRLIQDLKVKESESKDSLSCVMRIAILDYILEYKIDE